MNEPQPNMNMPQGRASFGWVDVGVFFALLGLLWAVAHFGHGMLVHFDESSMPPLETSLLYIPYYAGRTLLRMWIAFGFSLLVTLTVGYAAAKNRTARAFILPAVDVLQSVPVLGFLSATVAGFMALFPGSILGVECASIFAIFTGQVWNMIFGFYRSMTTIPSDLQEAASSFGMNRWQRFTTVEVPASMNNLIWNSMMSFGGGWFFVAQSEAIHVMNKNLQLPGLGSYMASAVERGDYHAAFWAIVAMLTVIVASDQLVWRPMVAWADKLKLEMTESSQAPTSWFYDLLRRAYLFTWFTETVLEPFSDWLKNITHRHHSTVIVTKKSRFTLVQIMLMIGGAAVGLWALWNAFNGLIAGIDAVYRHVPLEELLHIVWLGVLTLLRVAAMTVLATLIWTPVGVWIGLNPKAARIAQPLVQMAASFPVNMTFPFVVGFFVAFHISMNWGSILLIAMGTQWYLLFNVIAGAMAIPNDLKETARTYGLKGWSLWRTLILPAVFPFWITGACTAAGGAWNASIVAEWATWGDTQLKADGLGSYIAEVTARGETPQIICSIAVMAIFVVVMNKLLWRPLYALAERRYSMD